MKKRWKNRIRITMAAVLCSLFISACGGDLDSRVVFTTGLNENEIFRIADEICKKEELMVYLTTTQNQYEKVYGTEIWNTEHNGITLEENVKDTVLARIAQIKTMSLMAAAREIVLTEEEAAAAERAATAYYGSLKEQEIAFLGVTQDTILGLYREYALAEKVYRTIIQDINPEISDDEARIITVQHIFFATTVSDENGNSSAMTAEEKAAVYQEAVKVKNLAISGEHDFEELAAQYSEDDKITYSFGKGVMDTAFEEEAFQLETNEVSRVVESGNGYHVIKCISTFNIEETDENKVKLLEQRRKDAFEEEYDAFVKTLIRQLNEEAFEAVTLIHDTQVTTDNFFEIYEEYME